MLNKWLDCMPETAQEPGESASMRTTLDQARKNAVTPMTHLFLRTGQTSREMTVKRHIDVKGSYFTHPGRKETIIHQMDAYFRNSETRKLKESFTFVVDNGVDMHRRRVAQTTQWKARQQTTRPLRLLHPTNLHFLTEQEQEAGHAKTSSRKTSSRFHLHQTLNHNFKEIVNQNSVLLINILNINFPKSLMDWRLGHQISSTSLVQHPSP